MHTILDVPANSKGSQRQPMHQKKLRKKAWMGPSCSTCKHDILLAEAAQEVKGGAHMFLRAISHLSTAPSSKLQNHDETCQASNFGNKYMQNMIMQGLTQGW